MRQAKHGPGCREGVEHRVLLLIDHAQSRHIQPGEDRACGVPLITLGPRLDSGGLSWSNLGAGLHDNVPTQSLPRWRTVESPCHDLRG